MDIVHLNHFFAKKSKNICTVQIVMDMGLTPPPYPHPKRTMSITKQIFYMKLFPKESVKKHESMAIPPLSWPELVHGLLISQKGFSQETTIG